MSRITRLLRARTPSQKPPSAGWRRRWEKRHPECLIQFGDACGLLDIKFGWDSCASAIRMGE